MGNSSISLLLLCLVIAVLGCDNSQYLSLDELKSYPLNKENGLYQSSQAGEVLLEAIYRPKDLIIAQDINVEDKQAWLDQAKKLDSLDYFVLRISRNGEEIENSFASDQAKYNQVVSYLSNAISDDLSLVRNTEITRLEGLAFVPTFGSSNASSILLVFKSNLTTIKEDFSIVFDDTMFGTGRNELKFKSQDILKSPKLKRN